MRGMTAGRYELGCRAKGRARGRPSGAMRNRLHHQWLRGGGRGTCGKLTTAGIASTRLERIDPADTGMLTLLAPFPLAAVHSAPDVPRAVGGQYRALPTASSICAYNRFYLPTLALLLFRRLGSR